MQVDREQPQEECQSQWMIRQLVSFDHA